MIKQDKHVHSPFCRHGSSDSFDMYVNKAMSLDREEMSFTEHFPLPFGVADKEFTDECSLRPDEVILYLEEVSKIKDKYKGRIKINKGFEVDYIEAKEKEIKNNLDEFGSKIEDSILSVHFVLYDGKYFPIDCLDGFEELLYLVGNVEKVYDLYFKTLYKAVKCDLGKYKPKRMGHPTLIRIFNKKYPADYNDNGLFDMILNEIKIRNMEIDFNSAGLRKQFCGESYPSGKFLKLAVDKKIRLIPGSDSHEAKHMEMLDRLEV